MLTLSLLLAAALQLPDTTCAAKIRRFTDGLRTEASRPNSLAPRRTRVRALAAEIDDVAARCARPVTPAPVDSAPRDSIPTPTPVDSVPPDPAPVDSLPSDSLPSDSLPADTLPTPQPSGVAELPRAVPTWPAQLATAPCTRTVVAAQLQAEVNSVGAGEVLCLAPGDRFRGTLTLPARGDSGWVVVRTAPASGQPAPATRVRPSQGATLATLEAIGTASAIVTAPRARGWYLTALEVRTDSTLGTLTYALVDLQTPPAAGDFARDLVLDRLWIHGWAHRPLRRCVALNSASTAIVHSWLDDCHEKGSDSQAIWGYAGPGPFLIHDNYLAGAGENVMFGGADPRFRGVHPSDITITRNHFDTPISWKGHWTKKNLFELKNAQRVRVDSNVFTGSWADGQTGIAWVLKSTNQGKSALQRDNGTRDVTMRHNLILHAAGALHLTGLSGESGRYTDSVTRRVEIAENYADVGGVPAYGHDNRGVAIWTAPQAVRLRRNTWLTPTGEGSAYNTSTTTVGAELTIDRDARTAGRYQLFGCWTGGCTPARLDVALIGTGTPKVSGVTLVPTLDAALAAGYGVSRATIDAATRGVVLTP